MHLFIPAGAPPWLVYLHITAGLLSIPAGAVAAVATKGGQTHRTAGQAFVTAMAVMGAGALVLGILIPQPANAWAGALVLYLVGTAWLAAQKPAPLVARAERAASIAAMGLIGLAAAFVAMAAASSGGRLGGETAGAYVPFIVMAGFCLAQDLRFRAAAAANARLRRHLWRMCTALFFATGSFFLGQQKVMPPEFRGSAVLWILGLAPLGVMAWWLWKTRRRVRPVAA